MYYIGFHKLFGEQLQKAWKKGTQGQSAREPYIIHTLIYQNYEYSLKKK